MDEQLMTAAKTLARWCYNRGVDERVLGCGDQLHRIVVDEGFDTHPCCDRPGGTGSHAVLKHTAQMLGATLLAQPA